MRMARDQTASKHGSSSRRANRDPDQFFDAESLDLERVPNPHLAFGGGRHFCIGAAHLGRLEGCVAIRAAIDRLRTLRPLVESIEYRPNLLFRVPESVPVSLA
jgi:mycocyclosin synthase